MALDHVPSKGFIHRDIKPENLLFDAQSNVKLADFGWSQFSKPNEIRNTFCGTLDYLAPEMIEKSHKHGKAVDIWSVGVLCFELLTGMSPFTPREPGKNEKLVEEQTYKNISGVKYNFPPKFPEEAKDLVSKILVKDPE